MVYIVLTMGGGEGSVYIVLTMGGGGGGCVHSFDKDCSLCTHQLRELAFSDGCLLRVELFQ